MGKHMSVEEAKDKGLTSMDVAEEKLSCFKTLLTKYFPEVVKEENIDFDQLKRVLGENVEADKERFGLNWPGKADCMKIIQQPSVATLKPDREGSVDFDKTENLFIEGDNLEVLKLLQKAYFGKVKMIYIDPPYNTGKEFIYPDKYAENLDTYLEYTGQKDSEGRKFATNTETAGRYHSNWLNMMYPRLYLAKNLLREDGVIFISIDDKEYANLKKLCDEIFGENNCLGTILWKKKTNGNNVGHIPPVHDYFLCYAKDAEEECLLGFRATEEFISKTYSNPDDDPNGAWTTSDLSANHEGPHFPITNPKTGKVYYPPEGRYWVFNEKEVLRRIDNGLIIFGKTGEAGPVQKKYLEEKGEIRFKPESWWDDHGYNSDGTAELSELFQPKIFDHPKPSRTLRNLCEIATTDKDIILDFFAGTCPLAQAVFSLNREDGMERHFILVQLPEITEEKSIAFKAGFKTIADLGKERISRVIDKASEQDPDYAGDLGFKAFKLAASNFNVWLGDTEDTEELGKQLEMAVEHTKEEATSEDILYELLLKAGFPLATQIEKVTMSGKEVFSVEDGAMLICLEKELTQEVLDTMAEAEPFRVVCLDEGFKGNDELKANAVQTFKSRAHDKETAITFTTV